MPKLVAKTPEEREWLKGRNKYPSGFCNEHNQVPAHEGTKPRTPNGHPRKTCPMWQTCPCSCHYLIDTMFASVGRPREDEVPNPEYHAPVSEFRMPEYPHPVSSEVAVMHDGVMTPPDAEYPVEPAGSPAAAPLASRRTPTGRAARGGLEAQVWEACREWVDMDGMVPSDQICSPKAVADFIADKYSIPTPSSGAINAVWDRWAKLGYAEQAKKPNRFVKFTGDGTWEELMRLKSSARTAKKSAESAARRGFR